MLNQLPVETKQLRLRRLRQDDLTAFHSYRSREDVARYQGFFPMSLEEAEQFLVAESQVSQLTPGEWHQIGVALPGDDLLIGDLGFWLSADQAQAEIGLSINPDYQGRGLGTAAVRTLLRLLFSATPVDLIVAKTDLRNLPCIALLQRAGMEQAAITTAEYKGELCTELVFAVRRSEFH